MRIVLLAAVAVAALGGQARADTPFIGEIRTFAFTFCPTGYLPTDGRLLAPLDYDPLFELIGTTYGGDGQTSFALPKTRVARTRTGAVLTDCIAYSGIFPSRP